MKAIKAKQYLAHLEALKALGATDPEKSYRSLRRLECAGHRIMEEYCNGTTTDQAMESYTNYATRMVKRILGIIPPGFFVNQDPRGYTLKLNPEDFPPGYTCNCKQDWGGYYILAPEF